MMLNNFGTTPIIVDKHLAEFTTHHNKLLSKKRWHSKRVYFYRVQKKWDKRFGTLQVPYVIITRGGIIVHPNTFERLKQVERDIADTLFRK